MLNSGIVAIYILILICAFMLNKDTLKTMTPTPNRLINATSPYLRQHAHNPVDWYEWSSEALDKARAEDKPILVSIGYSSCHWCHVMERESFENNDIAAIMNEHFVCIKVDREERPDIDQIYMEAVQAMGINGGWPLNVFLTPDQKPFYGGTYFPPQNWAQVLNSIHRAYTTRRDEVENSSKEISEFLMRNDTERFRAQAMESALHNDLEKTYTKLASRFDTAWGGMDKAPKFVMPSTWLYLLRYHHLTKNEKALDQVLLTLKRVAMGGIYDQIGGGFARYSVDGQWFAPHFEKMLYDNGQLMSLYSEAYAVTRDPEFKMIVHETFDWLKREMTGESGGFYSALDADSEGEEGKFYVWTKSELEKVLAKDADLISDYYFVRDTGNWEHGNNILTRREHDDVFLKKNDLTAEAWNTTLQTAKKKLLAARDKRVRPGLDDKVLTSWNAMMTVGLIDAYRVLGDDKFLEAAVDNMRFIEKELMDQGTLYRSFKGKRSDIKGFLDDYAYVIQASIRLYEVTFDEAWIRMAEKLMQYTIDHFYDTKDGYFNYADKDAEKLIATKKEIFDNVIPSSNSVMARNLIHLGIILDNEERKEMANTMVTPLTNLIHTEPNYMSNWALALTEMKKGMAEVIFIGNDIEELRKEFTREYHPYALVMGARESGSLPLIKDKIAMDGRSTIYVCYNKTCKLPVHRVEEARKQLVK